MNNIQLLEALEKRPELKGYIERLLEISSGVDEELALADAAEEATIIACRGVGKSALEGWAESRAKKTADRIERRVNSANKNVKKKFNGRAHSEK